MNFMSFIFGLLSNTSKGRRRGQLLNVIFTLNLQKWDNKKVIHTFSADSNEDAAAGSFK